MEGGLWPQGSHGQVLPWTHGRWDGPAWISAAGASSPVGQQEVLLRQSQEPAPLALFQGLVQVLPALDLQLKLGKILLLVMVLD